MLTNELRRVQAETGLVPPDRLRALSFALLRSAADAREASRSHADGVNSRAAAALRGKAMAYQEAALMAEHILDGHALHPRRFSAAARLAKAYSERRNARRSGLS